ncbi:MAG: hemin uptake protein HemP [Rhizobiaceae bacterium]|nr:hemin uptake protein HemP [Rhizobiaceae bacterium]MCV0408771.1 hemin uptake protein HemP [Rhizobiaceae bacterium]
MNTRPTFKPDHRFPPRDGYRHPPASLAFQPSRTVTSESLFRGTHEIGIEHEGSLYRLKITRQGKLILNK